MKTTILVAVLMFSNGAFAKLAYDLTQFDGTSAGGTVKNRIPFTVYFIQDVVANGKTVSVAGIQSNDRSSVEKIDPKQVKVLTDKDMEQVNEFITTIFKLEPKPYQEVGYKLACGEVKHIIESMSVVGPRNPGSNGVGCSAIGGLSPKAAQVFELIERAVKSDTYKSLADVEREKAN